MTTPSMREKILTVAAQLFAARGYSDVSMRHIAKAVGMTQANLYHYFKDKEELIRSVLSFVFLDGAHSLEAALEGIDDADQRLECALTWFFTLLFENDVLAKLFFRELLTEDKERLKFLTEHIIQTPFDAFVKILAESLDTEDSLLSAIYLTSTIIGYCQFSGVIMHLHGAKPEYFEPETMARHLMSQIRKFSKKPSLSREAG